MPRRASCSSGTRAPGWLAAGPSELRRPVENGHGPMSVYAQLKLTFRTVVPTPVRDAVWSKHNPLRGALLSLKGALERSAQHDEIYDRSYYERSADAKRVTMRHIADSIVRDASPGTLVDVGC